MIFLYEVKDQGFLSNDPIDCLVVLYLLVGSVFFIYTSEKDKEEQEHHKGKVNI